jgi:UrcA family protein
MRQGEIMATVVSTRRNSPQFSSLFNQEGIMHISTMSRFVGLALAIAVSGAAIADSAEPVSSRVVRFADLNLRSREGATVGYQRIARAADGVCSLSSGIRTLGRTATMAAQVRECKTKVIEQAVTQVNAPMLTNVSREKSHRNDQGIRLVHAP